MVSVGPVLTLIIDTSSAAVTAAIVDVAGSADDPEVGVRAERVTVDARAHGELLAPQIESCLHAAGAVPGDLGAVVAGVGPGPFTGLRVGLVTAGVFADALGLPSYGVCSLDAIGARARPTGPVLVAGDARRREIYWARYLDGRRTEGPHVDRPAELPELGTDGVVTGAGARLYAEVLGGRLLDVDFPSAVALARLAAERILAGAPSERLVPLYLRRPDAVAPLEYKSVTPS